MEWKATTAKPQMRSRTGGGGAMASSINASLAPETSARDRYEIRMASPAVCAEPDPSAGITMRSRPK